MNTLDLRHSSSTSHLNTTDPLVILFLIENTEKTAENWHVLRDHSLPAFLSSFRTANPNVPMNIVKMSTSGKLYPLLITFDNENALKDIEFDESTYQVMSATSVKENLRTFVSFTSKGQYASRHLVLISASDGIDDFNNSDTQTLATGLQQNEISLHTFMDNGHEQNFILDIFSKLHKTNISDRKDGSMQFPASSSDNWIFRSTVSQTSTIAASLIWTPTLFSPNLVVLDAGEFQDATSAEVLRKSEEDYDWNKLRALAAKK